MPILSSFLNISFSSFIWFYQLTSQLSNDTTITCCPMLMKLPVYIFFMLLVPVAYHIFLCCLVFTVLSELFDSRNRVMSFRFIFCEYVNAYNVLKVVEIGWYNATNQLTIYCYDAFLLHWFLYIYVCHSVLRQVY